MALNPVLIVWTLTMNLMLPGEFALAFLQIYTAIRVFYFLSALFSVTGRKNWSSFVLQIDRSCG